MNNEEIQPGIAMETASPLEQLDRKRGCMLLLKGAHTHTCSHTLSLVITILMARPRSTVFVCLIFSLCDQWPE